MNAFEWWSNLDQLGFTVIGALLSVVWQSAVLFLIMAPLVWAMRNRTAAVRQTLWFGALILTPLLPLLTGAVNYAGLPQAPVPLLTTYEPHVLFPTAIPEPFMVEELESPVEESMTAPTAPVAPRHRDRNAELSFSIADYPWALGFLVYATGLVLFGSRFVIGHFRIRRWIRCAVPLSDKRTCEAFDDARETLDLKRAIPLLRSDRVRAPITAGALRTVVLIPSMLMNELSDVQLRAIALHESAHAKRRDPLVLSLSVLVRTVLFFHPLTWLASRQISMLSELAADEAVLRVTGEPVTYAKLLTQLAEGLPAQSRPTELVAGILLSKSTFLRRIEAVLSAQVGQFKRLTRLALTGTIVVSAAGLGIASAVPLTQKQTETVVSSDPAIQGSATANGLVATSAAAQLTPGFALAATSTGEITFLKDVLPILKRNCRGCHPGIPLTNYHEVQPWARMIDHLVQDDQRYVEHPDMGTPPSPLGEDEVQTIHRWLRFRAPRTVPDGQAGASYTEDIQPILEMSCLQCHSQKPISMSLAEYPEVRPWAKAIRHLTQSEELYVEHTKHGRLKDFLTDSEVATIYAWVTAGSPQGVALEADTVPAGSTSKTYVESDQFGFALPDFDGNMVSLDDPRFRNKVVLVDLWGTWCLPCATATPHLIDLYTKYRPAGLEVIGIAYEKHDTADDRHEAVAAFRREFEIPYTLLDGGPIENGIQRTLPTLKKFEGYPTMIIIGRDGSVKMIEVGFLPGAERPLEKIIVELLGERRER